MIPYEAETTEFKKTLGQKEKSGEDLVAFANKNGGIIYFGISDERTILGIQNFSEKMLRDLSQIYTDNTEPKLYPEITKEIISGKDVIKVTIQPSQTPYHTFKGKAYLRVGSSSKYMGQEEYKKRLLEYQRNIYDFSAKICEGVSVDDLEPSALDVLQRQWARKEGNESFLTFSHEEVLEKLLLKRGECITMTALLLCGRPDKITEFIPEAEVRFGWKHDSSKIDFDFKNDWRAPFLLSLNDIWEHIHARNVRYPLEQGFFEGDIWAFDQKSVREAILNAFAHRNYEERGSIFIEASPEFLIVKSPGLFLPGVSPENILDVQGKWRNRLLMETLGKIGLVERYGHGLDRIFSRSIREGKGKPKIEELSSRFVQLTIPAQIKDEKFIIFLERIAKEKQISFDFVKDLLFLDEIRVTQVSQDTERKNKFLELGVLEKFGKGRGTKYVLSSEFYTFLGKKAEYTRKRWLAKGQQKEILWKFFQQHKKGRMSDFRDELFEGKLKNPQILRLLTELRAEGKIYFDGPQRSPSGYWKIKE